MPELYLRGDGCGTGMTSAGNAWCRNRRVSRRCSQAGDAAAPAAAFRLKRRNNQFVIEIDPHTHAIVWQFGNGSDKAGPHSIVGTNDAERFGPLTLISGTGIPPASQPLPGQFTARGTVSGAAFASRLHNGNTLITDANNNRIVEVNAADAPV